MAFFILFISPLLFVMTVWVVVSVYRILDDREEVQVPRPHRFRLSLNPVGEPVYEGVAQTAGSGRRRRYQDAPYVPYDYAFGYSDGIPEAWWDDVVARRN